MNNANKNASEKASKKASFGGIVAALCVVLLCLCSYMPTGRIAMLFVASAVIYIFAKSFDVGSAFCVYLAVSIISVIIGRSGNIAVGLAFAVCLGNYPLFKAMLDKYDIKIRIIVKAVIFALYLALAWLGARYVLKVSTQYSFVLVAGVSAVMFFAYDRLLGMVCNYAHRYVQSIIKK